MENHEQPSEHKSQLDKTGEEPDMETKKVETVNDSDDFVDFDFSPEEHKVNGDRKEEIAGSTPTREEFIQLVKYWCKEYFFVEWIVFLRGARKDNDNREQLYANDRISHARAVIGEEAVNKAVDEARKEFKATSDCHSRYWDICEHGTSEQRDAAREEMEREVREQDAAMSDIHFRRLIICGRGTSEEMEREVREQDARKTLNRLEQVAKAFQGDSIALVLYDDTRRHDKLVLMFPTISELTVLIQSNDKFEIETETSRIRALVIEEHFSSLGLLRVIRHDGEWLFEFPDFQPGKDNPAGLFWVSCQIKSLLKTPCLLSF